MSLGVELKRGPNDLPANSARAPPISLHLLTVVLIRFLSSGGSAVLCLNAISQHIVNICHFRIYISCYYLLGLGLRAVSLGVLDFHQRELSLEERSSHNHGAARQCFSSRRPIYRHPKWLHFCCTQQNEEYLMTSIFIKGCLPPSPHSFLSLVHLCTPQDPV